MKRNQFKYNIGEVSKISGLSIKALRYYDEKGIVVPSERDESNNYRYYSEEQILLTLSIQEMRLRGLTVEEMKKVLNADSLHPINEILNHKIEALQSEIETLEKQKKRVENSRNLLLDALSTIGNYKQENHSREIMVTEFPKRTCVYSRYNSRIFADEVFWDRFADIYTLINRYNYTMSGPMTGIFHEHYTRQFFFEDGDLEMIVPVNDGDITKEGVKEFGGFQTASSIFIGYYNKLLPEYIALVKWIEDNQYEITGDPMEEYLVEFTHGVNKNEYVTRVHFPVRKK